MGGSIVEQELLPGAQIVVEVGEQVNKDDPITTNPNVGGFSQAEKEVVLQDMNRVYAYCAISISIFLSQLSFVLKKKQFEKVQLAEGVLELARFLEAQVFGHKLATECASRGSRWEPRRSYDPLRVHQLGWVDAGDGKLAAPRPSTTTLL